MERFTVQNSELKRSPRFALFERSERGNGMTWLKEGILSTEVMKDLQKNYRKEDCKISVLSVPIYIYLFSLIHFRLFTT